METNQAKNKALIERFPFLMPRNRWTDKIPEDFDSYTELDAMPDGWRKAFGEQMCEEIRAELMRVNYLDKYRITQIKEKYGSLRWYDLGCTDRMLHEIIPKYESLSVRTCIQCDEPVTKISTSWISPYCDVCADKVGRYERFVPIDVFLENEQWGSDFPTERIEQKHEENTDAL